MMGLEFERGRRNWWPFLTGLSAFLALVLGIWVGPSGVYIASGAGLFFALVSFFTPSSRLLTGILLGVHLVFLMTGFVLDRLFLKPLSDSMMQMPKLSQVYSDPDGIFRVRGPEGWDHERLVSPIEVGVRFRPVGMAQYMGVSDLTVRVRQLERAEPISDSFFHKLAETLSTDRTGAKKIFKSDMRPATLLNRDKAMWSDLEVKQFWVPVYQRALFGLKNKTFLCSVSATGIKSHGTLSEVLCLGVFETIKINYQRKTDAIPVKINP